ncbi:MAG TPA: alpha/beta hydrolase [Methylobacterium sp.]|uniref:alpha/beta fold hydrolase n=1 Tax=Methylorubrum sp. B1-46 TaxID=2897334 RepID=UPI001E382BE3|nr:alpha/beta hydrolase [Methylorubrum sp. B1-46]UGB28020.1 alpha/beta hydrolase [Methylorubrum sp. B1-46]HEV2541473.1 alpha/beta hydrolase [Methylobacterium sp.]
MGAFGRMRNSLSFTPPDLQEARLEPVRRRIVFYIPGYDPEARTRYRLLFVREWTRYTKRFGGGRREISRAELSQDGLVQSWTVSAPEQGDGAETRYDVLLWDDIVARDFARSRFLSVALLVAGTLQTILSGLLFRFYRLSWKYGNVILYPFVMVILLAALSVAIAVTVHAHLGDWFGHSLGLPLWVSLPLGVIAGLVWIKTIEAFLNRVFFWQLLNDWVFNWQHGQGRRPDYERRLDAFAEHVLSSVAARDEAGQPTDEVMIVGHSSGGLTAAEVAARVLARDASIGSSGASLSLATLGSGLPLVAMQPAAARLRGEIARLVTDRRIVWCDFHAPQDWMNFPGFNPLNDLKLRLCGQPVANPLVRSARFRDLLCPETYRRVRFRPFRMHFQFLLANERPGAYDFFAMTLGPRRLREQVLAPATGRECEAALPL